MPAERLPMRKIYEILRLKYDCRRSLREIATSCGVGKSTVSDYLLRFKAAGLEWPLSPELDEAGLNRLLFCDQERASAAVAECLTTTDWAQVQRELRGNKHVTLALLWQEYKECHPDGMQYSWFCQQYSQWRGKRDLVMRQDHRAGEKTFIDYAGQTVPIIDGLTGEIREAQVFLAVLGASNYTYAEATWSQRLPDWIGSHVRAFAWFGGVTELLIPDNLKSGVDKACRYEPVLNPTYHDLATHYQTTVLPARARKPKDKAKAEAGVLLVERWILARLRPVFSVLMNLTGRSGACWIYSTTALSRSRPAAAGVCTRALTTRPCAPCRRPSISLRNGKRPRSTSITISSWRAIIIVSPTPWWAGWWRYVTPPTPWSACARGNGWLRIPDPCSRASTAPSRSICRPITGSMPNGVRNGSSAGRPRSGRP